MAHFAHQFLDGHEILVCVQVGVLGLQVVLEHNDVLVPRLVDQLPVHDLGVARVEQDHAVDEGVDGEVVLHQRFHGAAVLHPKLPKIQCIINAILFDKHMHTHTHTHTRARAHTQKQFWEKSISFIVLFLAGY